MADPTGRPHARYVAGIFSRIARRYDFLNSMMSMGRHHAWRRTALDLMMDGAFKSSVSSALPPEVENCWAIDIASGTGDFALELANRSSAIEIVGIDFVKEMLDEARQKMLHKNSCNQITLISGDAHHLPFESETFSYVTVGFGARNFYDLPEAISEMVRVLRPGGRIAVLEIVRHKGGGPLDLAGRICFKYITPLLGAFFAGDLKSYAYLPRSAEGFVSGEDLALMLQDSGLDIVNIRELALGIVAIVIGEKRKTKSST